MNLGEGSYSSIDIPGWLKVGKYSSIAAYTNFLEGNQHHLCKYNKKCVFTTNWFQPWDNPQSEVGNDVWIGAHVLILPGIKIGDGAIIGAGTVVTKDVNPYAIVVGNPGKVKRYRFDKEIVKKLLEIKWWDWGLDKINKAKEEGSFLDIDKFLEKYG